MRRGDALAAESMRTDAMIIRLALPTLLPTLATTGRMMMAATVDDTKLAMSAMNTENATVNVQSEAPESVVWMVVDMIWRRKDLSITCPSASPPPMRMRTDQLSNSGSSSDDNHNAD